MAIPTSTMFLSTTCLVVTQPASTDTVRYSSGQVGFLPATTYTAPKTILYTHEATVEARCFTLGPGQIVPPAVSFFGASCSTEYRPGSTETTTYTKTPGEPFVAFGRTLTVYTGTTTRNPATCDTITPLTWASLILTFITMHLTWWIFDVPLLWKKRADHDPHLENKTKRDAAADANDRLGLAGFLFTIAWACLRANAPGCSALYVLIAGRDTGEYAAMYYLGVRRLRDGRVPEFTTWKLTISIGADLLSLAVVGVTVYQACTLPEYAPQRWGASMWAYPSLPTALIGLCFLAGRYWFPRIRRAAVALVVMVRFDPSNSGWFMSVIFYGAMAFPAVLVGGPFILIAIGYGCFARVGGVTIAAWQHYAGGQPYCKMPGIGFAVVYLSLGGISALLALLAIVLYHTDMRWRIWYRSLDLRASPTDIPELGRNIGERREGTIVLK